MYYLTLAMKTINITQKPGGSFSHPNGAMDLAGVDSGVDFFYCRTGYMKCISKWRIGYNTFMFQPCDEKGNAVKVMCADGKARIVTIAMTHSGMRYVRTKVGHIYKQGEALYEEGKTGKATGNHIHIEVAEGTVTKKKYDWSKKVYRMAGELDPSKVFYIDDTFSKIKSLDGLDMKICHGSKVPEETKKVESDSIAFGYHTYTKNGIKARVYRADSKKGYTLHLISSGDATELKPIAKFDSDKITKVAVLNCNYFDLKSHYHYGVEQDGLIRGFTQAPKSSGLLCYYVDQAGVGRVVPSDNYWYGQNYVQCAFTPYAVTMLGGRDVNYRSSNLADKKNVRNTQSAVARLGNGDFVLAAFERAYPKDVREFFKAFKDDKVLDVCVLDSGGSTQLRVWTGGAMQTVVAGDKRQLPNVLCLAKEAS